MARSRSPSCRTASDSAVEEDWIGTDPEFSTRRVIDDLGPDGSFEAKRVDSAAREGAIASRIRRTAVELDASVVFLGSENAGRIVVPVSSVGGTVAADDRYDVHVVRHRRPAALRRSDERSDFFPECRAGTPSPAPVTACGSPGVGPYNDRGVF